MTKLKAVKARRRRSQLLNELVFTPRACSSGVVRVDVENAPAADVAFFKAIAKVIEIWISRTWRW